MDSDQTRPSRPAAPNTVVDARPPPAPLDDTQPDVAAPARAPRAPSPPRPFDWSALPRLSRAAVALQRAFALDARIAARLLDELSSDLTHDLGAPVRVICERIEARKPPPEPGSAGLLVVRRRALAAPLSDLSLDLRPNPESGLHEGGPDCGQRKLADLDSSFFVDPGFLAVVELAPLPGDLLVELDPALALAVVDRLAGGEGRAPASLRAPTALERGILSYLLLRALARLATALEPLGVTPRLRGFAAAPAERRGADVAVHLFVDAAHAEGRVRLLVPAALVSAAPWLTAKRERALPGPLAAVGVDVALELGEAWLTSADLAGLAPQDVVLCTPFIPQYGVGRGGGSAADAKLSVLVRPRGARLGFEGILAAGATPERTLTLGAVRTAQGAPMSDSPAAGAALLADATLPVTVELARLTLRAEELAALRSGDTLLVGRAPGAPLELCVGGKVVARGELVDVDGELGLRILTVG